VAGIPSRFIAEMKLHETDAAKENPLERLKRQRAEAAARAAAAAASATSP
jgi:ATP-dependent DNA helicase Rep